MSKKRTKIIALAAGAVLASGVIAACGGDEVSPDEYVGSLCTAFGDFQSTLAEGQATVQQAAAGGLDPEAGKEQLSSFFSEAAAASEEAANEVEEAGTPDVENGEQIAEAIGAAFGGITQALEQAQTEIEALPTESEESFATAAQNLATNLQDSVGQVGEGLEQVAQSPELEQAAEENEACQELEASAASGVTGTTGP